MYTAARVEVMDFLQERVNNCSYCVPLESGGWDFAGGPVVDLTSPCRGCGFCPWSGRYDHTSLVTKINKSQVIKQALTSVTNSVKGLKMAHIKKYLS